MNYRDQIIAHALLAHSGLLRTGKPRQEMVGQFRTGGPRVYTPRVADIESRSEEADHRLVNQDREVKHHGQ